MIFNEIGEGCAISMSYIEIYNEEVSDLLTDSPTQAPPKLKIRGDVKSADGVFVENAKELDYFDATELIASITLCAAKRKSAETLLNARSSRSHTICQLTVKEFTTEGYHKRGRFKLVDLAGSECIGKSGVINQGQKEAGQINQSLLTLGRVINAINERAAHIPYRDSKLTQLLQDSIGGTAKTLMIATFSPMSGTSAAETLGTLAYAASVRAIRNRLVFRDEFVKCDPVAMMESRMKTEYLWKMKLGENKCLTLV
ncbi:kinesin motor domain-containing protein [Chytridium lagenaria]|nr:kinesin motor domain-containing protein [Chytridium lagenaria]